MKILKIISILILIIFLSYIDLSCQLLTDLKNNSKYRYISKKFDGEKIIDTTYNQDKDTSNRKVAEKQDDLTIVKEFSKDSFLISFESFSDYEKRILSGETKYYYPNGMIKTEANYIKNKLDGKLITYHKNGKIKRNDFYKLDSLISGICYDSIGNEMKYFKYSIDPGFNLQKFTSKIIYPEHLKAQGIQEKVDLRILLNKYGKIVKIKFDLNNLSGFIKAAIETLLNNDLFIPAYLDGEPVSCWITVPIDFRLKIK